MSTHNHAASGPQARPCYQPPPLPADKIKLAALRTAFPDFAFTISAMAGRRCWVALRVHGDGPLVQVACAGAIELWRVLRRAGG